MKIHRKKAVIAGMIVAAILTVAYFLCTQTGKMPGKEGLKIIADKADLTVKDVHYTDVSESGSKWEVRADTARYIRNTNLALFDNITVKLFMTNGKEFVLHADTGEMKTDTKDMTVSGNVVVVSNNGDRFTTAYLTYSDTEKRFQTDAPVAMENSRTKIQGVGMWLSLKEENAAILSGVKAVIQ
jgi:LPS export ABC transporter protein LptC